MWIHSWIGLQCLAIFLLSTVFTTCAEGSSGTFSPVSSSSSMSTVSPPYGNTTITAPTLSPTTSSSNSMTNPTEIGKYFSPTESGSSTATTNGTGTSSPAESDGSMTTPTNTSTSSPSSSVPATNGTGTLPLTGSTTITPTTSMADASNSPFGNGTSMSPTSTNSSRSVPTSSVAGTGTAAPSESWTNTSSTPTSHVTGFSSAMTSSPSPFPTSSGNLTSTPSNPTGGSTPTSKANIGSFQYQGCAASSSNFSSFTLINKAPSMTLEKCISECGALNYTYAGIYVTKCYCANALTSDVTVTPGQGSCYLPCPGDSSESCGGNAPATKRGLRKRQAQSRELLSLFADTAEGAVSSNPTSISSMSTSLLSTNSTGHTFTRPTSTAGVPTQATPSGSGSGNLSTPTGSTNAPFRNGTSTSSSGPPTTLLIVNSTTTPSALFGNGSTTTSRSSPPQISLNPATTTSARSSNSLAVSLGIPTSSSSTGSQNLSSTPSSGTNVSVATTGSLTNPTNMVSFTITEIIYTTTSFCPATISTVISGMPAYILTKSVSTIVVTSTIIIPCHKCLEPSQMITLAPAVTATGPYQSLSPQPSDAFEGIVTEIIYTSVSTCRVTTGTSVFSGSTSYYVTNAVSTLTLTATTAVPCQNCSPQYATVTVILIGSAPKDSTGNAAGVSRGPSLSVAASNQSPSNVAGQVSCPGCGSPLNEDVGMETTIIATTKASPTANLSHAAQTSTQAMASLTANLSPAAQTITQGSTYGSGQSTVPAGRSMTATSSPTNHGPYLMSSSEKSMKIFTQTMALGLILAIGAWLAMH